MTNDEIIAQEEGGITNATADLVKEELSGGFVKANSLAELDKNAPQQNDQPADNGNGEATSNDSIGLSDDKANPSEVATDDRGEEDGGSASTSTPADEAAEENTENESSPFTTVEDEELNENNSSAEEEEFVSDDEYFTELSEKIGYEVTTDEDLITLVRHLDSQDPLEGVSPLLKQVIEFESNGGDVREYFNVLSVNSESLSEKEAMWHKFKISNSTLSQESPEFARQKFERDFDTKYKILSDQRGEDDFDSQEDFANFKRDQEYLRQELKWESQEAKKELDASREEALKTAPVQAQVNIEEQQRLLAEYQEQASYYKENFDTLQIPIDAEGKTNYNIGLNEKSRPMFEEWMDSPSKFLDYIGIGSDQKTVNAELLAANMALIAAFSVDGEHSVGAQFANAMTERLNKNSVESRLENPAPEGGKSNSGGEGGKSELQEAVEAFRDDVMLRGRRR